MSVSLSNIESRVAALEKKFVDTSSVVVEADWGQHGYCILRGGLMLNWGYNTKTFKKAFPHTCSGICSFPVKYDGSWASDAMINSYDRYGYSTLRGTNTYYIAIGY